MMKKRMNNKGYSLVELIVVIALMAIGLSLFTISMATIVSNNVRSAASDIDSQISRGLVNANYRNPYVFIEIAEDGDNLVVRYFENSDYSNAVEEKIIGGSNITVSYSGFPSSPAAPSSTLPLILAFERGKNEIKQVTDTSPASFAAQSFDESAVPTITIGTSSGTSTTYTITLTPLTGGHEVTRN